MNNTNISQETVILRKLKRANGQRVPMIKLSRLSGSLNVHSRIASIRRRFGVTILNEIEVRDGIKRSFYRMP